MTKEELHEKYEQLMDYAAHHPDSDYVQELGNQLLTEMAEFLFGKESL